MNKNGNYRKNMYLFSSSKIVMSNIFNIRPNDDDDEDVHTKINMDELYESKQKKDLAKLNVFKKILGRVHQKIKTTNRITRNSPCCWFTVPEVILGIPYYDHIACIEFLVHELEENGFIVRYNHPNVLFVSWNHWVPSYVRSEIKKKTGVEVDGYGNVVEKKEKQPDLNFAPKSNSSSDTKKNYKDISSYTPSGKFIYDDIFKK